MTKKKHNYQISIVNCQLAFALALALTACSEERYDGVSAEDGGAEIVLGTVNKATTRSNTGLERYEGTMKVYAAKKMIATSQYEKAIGNYAVWNTSSDPTLEGDWEYVGKKDETKTVVIGSTGGQTFTLPQDQVRKYWDYRASEYMFWAIAPYSDDITYNITDGCVNGVTIKGVGGHLTANPDGPANVYKDFYVAEPVKVEKADFGNGTDNSPVEFNFDHMHAKVRVAIYENIPNYHVDSVRFYKPGEATPSSQNVVLCRDDNAFVGGNNGTANVIHNNNLITYNLEYVTGEGTGLTAQNWIELGRFHLGMADPADQTYFVKLFGSDADMEASTCYFNVLPTPYECTGSNAKPIKIKIDFTIKADDTSGEKTRVRGVSTTVPLQFSTWLPNHAYSYVFKVTQTSLGLTQIEFDAEMSSITGGSEEHEEVVDEP